jgi:hypothetical protein
MGPEREEEEEEIHLDFPAFTLLQASFYRVGRI